MGFPATPEEQRTLSRNDTKPRSSFDLAILPPYR
jgi:hypothetical protein